MLIYRAHGTEILDSLDCFLGDGIFISSFGYCSTLLSVAVIKHSDP